MSNIINVQLSYFCDYHIQTSVESITKLMEGLNGLGFGELLPSMIPGQKLNLLEGKAIPTTNLSFNSTDGSIQIVCMDNRIDCIIRPTVSEKIDLDKDLLKSRKLLDVIISHYNILGNRLAINIDVIGNNKSDFSTTKFGRTLSSSINYYNGKIISEISANLNTRIPIQLSEVKEIVNVITNINTAVNNKDQSNLLLCHIDINTVPEKQGLRFKNDVLEQFVNQIKGIIQQIVAEFEVMDNEGSND